jgi:hypothetical protein
MSFRDTGQLNQFAVLLEESKLSKVWVDLGFAVIGSSCLSLLGCNETICSNKQRLSVVLFASMEDCSDEVEGY